MRLLINLAAMFAIASCGAMNQQSSKSIVSEEAAIAHAATLPAVTIVRVPVGADGKEINDKAELRVTSVKNISASSVSSAFDSASAPESTVDELDKTSSTESFCGWRRWRRNHAYAYSYNYNYNYSYNQCGTGQCGNYNWAFYTPTYYNYGYYYNYNYANSYSHAGYNYYQYNSSFSNSYSGYGWAPGYGY